MHTHSLAVERIRMRETCACDALCVLSLNDIYITHSLLLLVCLVCTGVRMTIEMPVRVQVKRTVCAI